MVTSALIVTNLIPSDKYIKDKMKGNPPRMGIDECSGPYSLKTMKVGKFYIYG